MKTGKYAKDGREMQVGDVVHFRCKNHPLSGKGVVFMGKEVDGLGEDPFRIRDTRTGRNVVLVMLAPGMIALKLLDWVYGKLYWKES